MLRLAATLLLCSVEVFGATYVHASTLSQIVFKGLTVGGKSSPKAIRRATGLECGIGANNAQVCNGAILIGPVTASANIVISGTGILERVNLYLDTANFDSVIQAFQQKYGTPDLQDSSTIVQNGFGVQGRQTTMQWRATSGVEIFAVRYANDLQHAMIMIQTEADRARLNSVTQVKPSDL